MLKKRFAPTKHRPRDIRHRNLDNILLIIIILYAQARRNTVVVLYNTLQYNKIIIILCFVLACSVFLQRDSASVRLPMSTWRFIRPASTGFRRDENVSLGIGEKNIWAPRPRHVAFDATSKYIYIYMCVYSPNLTTSFWGGRSGKRKNEKTTTADYAFVNYYYY